MERRTKAFRLIENGNMLEYLTSGARIVFHVRALFSYMRELFCKNIFFFPLPLPSRHGEPPHFKWNPIICHFFYKYGLFQKGDYLKTINSSMSKHQKSFCFHTPADLQIDSPIQHRLSLRRAVKAGNDCKRIPSLPDVQ